MRGETLCSRYAGFWKKQASINNINSDRIYNMCSMNRSVFLLTLSLLVNLGTGQDIREPPSVQEPPADKIPGLYIKPGTAVQLPCEATGKPQPMYSWMHNGKELNITKTNFQHIEMGTIEITDFDEEDAGEYQCVASNKYGMSLSQVFPVKVASLTTTGKKEVILYSGDVGKYLKISKTGIISVPEPSYEWMTVADVNDPSPRHLVRDKRILQDLEGNLYFTSLHASDKLENGRFYKLNVFNHKMDATLGGSYTRIDVYSFFGMKLHDSMLQPPSCIYPTPSTLVIDVLEGTEMRIQCIFSGYPDVDVTWSGPSKSWATTEEFGTRLVLKNMTKEAAGEYECTGTNRAGAARSKITVEMHSIPKFTPRGRPSKQILTEGETATFTCQTTEDTNPHATVEWMINGEIVKENRPGVHTKVTDIQNGKTLMIRDLNRDEDIKVIQCKASNKHRTIYIDAPLNVIKKTTLTEKPVNQTIEPDTTHVTFVCRATSDPSTPVIVEWLRNGEMLSYYDDPRITEDKEAGTLTLNLDGLDEDKKLGYHVKVKCRATNGYSSDSHTAVLEHRALELQSVRESVSLPPKFQWIIPLIVVSILTAAIAIFCIIMRKNGRLCNTTSPRSSEQPDQPPPRIIVESDQDGATSEPHVRYMRGHIYEDIDENQIQNPSPISQQAVEEERDDGHIDQRKKVPRRRKKLPAPIPRPEDQRTSPTRHSYLMIIGDQPVPEHDEQEYLQPCVLCVHRACHCVDNSSGIIEDMNVSRLAPIQSQSLESL